MDRNIYVLLVGIDKYPTSVNPLRGCVNDIHHVERLLRARVGTQGDRLDLLKLTDTQATRDAIIAGFRTHLGKAREGDVVLFYYSGHGSQAPSPPEFWHLEPDHLDETLVCWDSRLPGKFDLADKELAQLIKEVADKGPHVTVILDCCHSGSGTRASGDEEVRIRRVPTDDRVRPLETFLLTLEQAETLAPTGRGDQPSGWYSLPQGRHVVLAACSAEEEAKELPLGGESRGAFSYYLLDTLQSTNANPTYRDVFKRVNALVRARVALQSPQMEATNIADLEQPFLGGTIVPGPPYCTVSYDTQRRWVIDGGAVHGIPPSTGTESTLLALFPFGTPTDELHDLSRAVGEARVQHVFPAQSAVTLTLTDGSTPSPETTYKAVITALPLPPIVVTLSGEEKGLALVRQALSETGMGDNTSLIVCEGPSNQAEFLLSAEDDRYRIRRKGDGYALVVDTPGFNGGSAQLVVQRLEHMARWKKILELTNPMSRYTAQAIRVDILRPDKENQWHLVNNVTAVRLEYEFEHGKWTQPQFKVKLTNTSRHRLFCMLLDLPETYGVFPELLPGGGIWLKPGEEAWANNGEPMYASVLDELWQQGVVEFKDTLKLIVSTDESDATLLRQGDLPVTVMRTANKATGAFVHLNSLNRLMHRVQTRHFSSNPATSEMIADWTTVEMSFTVVRPLEAVAIAKLGQQAALGHNVTVHGHPSLQGNARLTSLPQAARDADNLTLPALLRDHPQIVEPFTFSTSRSGEPGLSVLELIDVKDHEVVTHDAPLKISIATSLAPNDHLLPVGFDGEFFLPLGRVSRSADGVDVTLERLPAPTNSGTRDLKGSIKILFQKLVGQRLGLRYDYPLLRAADVAKDGTLTYSETSDLSELRTRVAKAKRILLYIHGIIGDTRAMAASARTEWSHLSPPVSSLADRYELVLTFDYENLHTTIEENARRLKERLAAIGLSANHGKTLHIVAHSMGGLVSRWFTEREGGNHIVQHLVMLGTPNAGSPWATVEDWATTALGLGLNGMTTVAWPASVVGMLVGALEKVDVSLDQMRPGSVFLQSLATSPAPDIAYTIIAGNTSIITTALATNATTQESLLSRLWEKLKPRHWLYAGAGPVFLGLPNDIAVAVESIQSVPVARSQLTLVDPIGCDHLTYFTTVVGLRALSEALSN
jgi:pimeloyl-ACP methyl ester carboxylesterase